MHILYIQQILHLPETPGNSRSFDIALEWVKNGHQVSILTSRSVIPCENLDFSAGFAYVDREGIEFYILDVGYSHLMSFSKRIAAFFHFVLKASRVGKQIKKVDVLLAYSPPLTVGWIGRYLATYHRVPWGLEVADVWPDVPIGMGLIRNPLLKYGLRKFGKSIYEDATHVFPFSEDMSIQLASYGVNSDRQTVVHNGPNVPIAPHISFSGDDHTVEIIYTGTVGIANDITQLLQVALIAQQNQRSDLIFTIIGEGNRLKEVKATAQSWGLTRVKFLKALPRTELPQLLAKADIGIVIFANHTVLEANGATKWFDYMAQGLPVITNYQGWQAQYMAQYNCGLSAPQGDLQQLWQQVCILADQAERRQEMGKNGHALVQKRFSRPYLATLTLNRLIEMKAATNW